MTAINSAEVKKICNASTTVFPDNSVDNRLAVAISGKPSDNSLPIDKKTERNNFIQKNIVEDHNISLKTFYQIAERAFGLNPDDLYELSDKEFKEKIVLIENKLELVNPELLLTEEDCAEKVCKEILKDKANGLTEQQSINLTQQLGDKDLFSLLKEQNVQLRKFMSLNEIKSPADVKLLQEAINKFISSHSNGKDNKDIGQAINLYKEILSRTCSESTYSVAFDAAKTLLNNKERVDAYIAALKKYENPGEIDNFVSEDNIKDLLSNPELTNEESKDVILTLNAKLESNTQIHNLVFSRWNKSTDSLLEYIQQVEDIPENKRTPEQQALIKIKDIITNNASASLSMVAIFAKTDEIKIDTIGIANKYSISEKVFEEAYKYAQEHPELDISKIFDDLTGGKYSKFVDDTYNKPAQSADISGSVSGDSGIGLPQKNITSEFVENLQASISDKNSALKEHAVKNFEFVKNDPVKSKKDDETKSNIALESYDTIIKKMAAGIYNTKDIFSRCTSNLNNGIGKVVLKLFDGYKSVADRSNHLNMLGSFIARGKVIRMKYDGDFSELEGKVVLTSDQKKLINENENKKEPS